MERRQQLSVSGRRSRSPSSSTSRPTPSDIFTSFTSSKPSLKTRTSSFQVLMRTAPSREPSLVRSSSDTDTASYGEASTMRSSTRSMASAPSGRQLAGGFEEGVDELRQAVQQGAVRRGEDDVLIAVGARDQDLVLHEELEQLLDLVGVLAEQLDDRLLGRRPLQDDVLAVLGAVLRPEKDEDGEDALRRDDGPSGEIDYLAPAEIATWRNGLLGWLR